MYIGVDCGTQSTKIVVVDDSDGRIVGEASRPHRLDQGDNGRREQRVEEWTEAFRGALGEALDDAGVSAGAVRAIGISGQQHGMVALDADGVPVHPAKLWNDTETAEWNARLIEAMGGEQGCIDRLGLVLQTGYTASKIAWLRETHPEAYRRIETLLLPHDYLNFWLTGERVAECGDASGTGYFDTRTRQWRRDVFELIAPELDADRVLPRLIESREAVGKVRPALAAELGLGDDVIVASGGGDNMMGAIGTGNIEAGMVTISLGTSGTIAVHSPEAVVPDNAMVANFCASHGGWLPLICTMNVTSATTTLRELVGLDIEGFNRAVEKAEPGAGGITLLPFFSGERVPALPQAHASLSGMTSFNTNPANLCRAAVESATFGLRYGLELLGFLAGQATQVRLVGGGAKSAVWRQIVADILDLEVVCPQVTEAAAFGGAIQARWCDRRESDASLSELCRDWVRLDDSTLTRPHPETVAKYHGIYRRYREALQKEHGIALPRGH
ncbi:xylulokinase [Salinicola rhizosphaerae]|uniref:Xylulose kinase n=1 Tax=Salinicola rhizosphaerae TaxID=1443141 RepID=A0ABQ3E007_9GAMM|nr:xylulokinase [Salinicola rhizosphaerae]GHB21840.1 xylulokinase [Salinicola rhizosphaerae]